MSNTGARSKVIYWLIAIPLAGILLYYSLRGVDWHRVWQVALGADPRLVGLAALITSVNCFIRALRWRILLTADRPIPAATVFWANSVGYLGNVFLPARAGEVLRSAMISARSGLSKTYVLTLALSERLIDALVLLAVAAMAVLTLEQKPAWLATASRPAAVIGLGGACALALLPRAEPLLHAVLLRLPVPAGLRKKLIELSGQVMLGIRSLHHPTRLAGFGALTALIWFCDVTSARILASALGLHLAIPVAILLIAGMGLGSALPSTPGYVGIYQFAAVTILMPFGFTRSDALAYSLFFQAFAYVTTAFWGLIGLWRYNR